MPDAGRPAQDPARRGCRTPAGGRANECQLGPDLVGINFADVSLSAIRRDALTRAENWPRL